MNVLLSVEPKFAEAILGGTKRWEFRTRKFQVTPKKAYIYCTSPVRKIVGFFKVGKVLFGPCEKIWKICGKEGGITHNEFINRFGNKHVYAMRIEEVRRFTPPVKIDFLGINDPPQSFIYFKGNFLLQLLEIESFLAQEIQNIFGGDGHGGKK